MVYESFAHVYDAVMSRFEYARWAEYLEKLFTKFKKHPDTILEIGCGTGNLTLELHNRGYSITAVDLSNDMLKVAQKKMIDQSVHIDFSNQNMCTLNVGKKFDCVISFMDVVNYIVHPKMLLQSFKNIYDHIEDNGIFIFDIRSPYVFINLMNDNTFAENTQDISYICENKYNAKKRTAQMCVTFFYRLDDTQNYKKNVEVHTLRCYTIDEITNILSEAKLKVLGIYDGLTLKKPSDNSERYVFVVSKL